MTHILCIINMTCSITKSRKELFDQYQCLFQPSNNRNAASHIWAKHILDHSSDMTVEEFTEQAASFCTVSGSPISRSNEFIQDLSTTTGSESRVVMNHCCWPCACDIKDANKQYKLHLHPTTIATQNGMVDTNYVVIDDPCKHSKDIPPEAPAIKCENDILVNAVHIETPIGEKVVVGFAFDTTKSINYPSEKCEARALDGYHSGMGTIFRDVLGLK